MSAQVSSLLGTGRGVVREMKIHVVFSNRKEPCSYLGQDSPPNFIKIKLAYNMG